MPSAAEKRRRGGVVRTTRTKIINGQRYVVTAYRKKGPRGGRTTMHKARS